jgi:hypothetical protein
MTEDDILQMLDRKDLEQQARTRSFLLEAGRPDLAAELDAKLRDIRLGVDGAQRTWAALSPAQRSVLEALSAGRHLRKVKWSKTRYDAYGEPHAIGNLCGIATVRNLCARDLCHVDGGMPDPEGKIIITERGRFVLKYGPTHV